MRVREHKCLLFGTRYRFACCADFYDDGQGEVWAYDAFGDPSREDDDLIFKFTFTDAPAELVALVRDGNSDKLANWILTNYPLARAYQERETTPRKL